MKLLSHTFAPRLLAGFGTAALVAGVGLFASSRPAHTAGGPIPVTVANTVPIRDTESPAQQPFQDQVAVDVSSGPGYYTFTTVPAGKRLVIESLTANYNLQNSAVSYTVSLYSSTGGVGLSLTPGSDPYPIKTQPVRLTAEAGDTLQVSVLGNADAKYATVYVSVSGYLVDVP